MSYTKPELMTMLNETAQRATEQAGKAEDMAKKIRMLRVARQAIRHLRLLMWGGKHIDKHGMPHPSEEEMLQENHRIDLEALRN